MSEELRNILRNILRDERARNPSDSVKAIAFSQIRRPNAAAYSDRRRNGNPLFRFEEGYF